jgi:hypothetical protein
MNLAAIRGAIACIGLCIVSAGAASAQQQVTRADVNGEWKGVLDLEGGRHDLSLVFELTDSAFVGWVYDTGRVFGQMERGTLSGDTVRFYIDQLAFTGVITGPKMTITLIVYNGGTRRFVATKKPSDNKGH